MAWCQVSCTSPSQYLWAVTPISSYIICNNPQKDRHVGHLDIMGKTSSVPVSTILIYIPFILEYSAHFYLFLGLLIFIISIYIYMYLSLSLYICIYIYMYIYIIYTMYVYIYIYIVFLKPAAQIQVSDQSRHWNHLMAKWCSPAQTRWRPMDLGRVLKRESTCKAHALLP
jgi:hypothetical protein